MLRIIIVSLLGWLVAFAAAADTPPPPLPPVGPRGILPVSPAQEAAREAILEKRTREAHKLLSDLSFDSCAFQYWSFMSDTGQNTDHSPDALSGAIDSYEADETAIVKELYANYGIDAQFIKVSNGAQQRILRTLLDTMPSKGYPHEQGVGTQDDMQSRCHAIASRWDLEPPLPKNDTGDSNSFNQNNREMPASR